MKTRKKYIVDKGFQIRFIGVMVFSMLLFLLMVGWTVYSNIWAVLLKDTRDPYFLIVKKYADIAIFYKLVLLMISITIISIFISHKFAGPVSRIRKCTKTIGQGNLCIHVNLRRGDEFVELVDDFNSMVKNLKSIVIKDKEKIKAISKRLKEISKDFKDKNLTTEIKDKISTEIGELLKEVEEIDSQFQV